MRGTHGLCALAAGLLASLGAPGCFAVANLDRFEVEPPTCEANATMTRDFRWRLSTFDPHQGRRFEMKVVEAMTGRVAAGIVYDPIPDGRPTTLEGFLDDALAPGDYETRFWADMQRHGPRLRPRHATMRGSKRCPRAAASSSRTWGPSMRTSSRSTTRSAAT